MKIEILDINELRKIVTEELSRDTKYFLYDEPYFEDLKNKSTVCRDLINLIKRKINRGQKFEIITFATSKEAEQIYEFVQGLRMENMIFATFYEEEYQECKIVFMQRNKKVSVLEKIEKFIDR